MEDKIKILRALNKIKQAMKLIKEAAADLSDKEAFSGELAQIEGMLKDAEELNEKSS